MKIVSQPGKISTFFKLNRAMLLDSIGLSCYIAWSFVFWNGSILFGDLFHETLIGEAQIAQAMLTALAALGLVLLAHKTAPLRRRIVLLAVFAVVSSLATVIAALTGFGCVPIDWMLVAFALSGLGSTLRLGWEERISVQGVERTAACVAASYIFGFLLFILISSFPLMLALSVSVLLPFCTFGLLFGCDVKRTKRDLSDQAQMMPDSFFLGGGGDRLCVSLLRVPWRPMTAIAFAFFGYGATRANGVASEFEISSIFCGVLTGVPALASFAAIFLAYFFYRRNATVAFYLAFPLIAIGSLLPVLPASFWSGTAFSMVLIGAELVKYLVWFLFIDSFFKDGLSVLLCLALMRFMQWIGSCLGQIVADVLPAPELVTIAILLSLLAALLVIMGLPLSSKTSVGAKSGAVDTLACRAGRVAVQCGLSPREQEILGIWITGHTSAYIEKRLFISKSTVKTHLNHIYAKTSTANREELLELLEGME